jgi:hypothetical protein
MVRKDDYFPTAIEDYYDTAYKIPAHKGRFSPFLHSFNAHANRARRFYNAHCALCIPPNCHSWPHWSILVSIGLGGGGLFQDHGQCQQDASKMHSTARRRKRRMTRCKASSLGWSCISWLRRPEGSRTGSHRTAWRLASNTSERVRWAASWRLSELAQRSELMR